MFIRGFVAVVCPCCAGARALRRGRSCWHICDPPHSLHVLLRRLRGQMLDPRRSLHSLLRRSCLHICDPPPFNPLAFILPWSPLRGMGAFSSSRLDWRTQQPSVNGLKMNTARLTEHDPFAKIVSPMLRSSVGATAVTSAFAWNSAHIGKSRVRRCLGLCCSSEEQQGTSSSRHHTPL